MDSPIPPLLGLHAYETSARHLSFAAAAAEMHLSASAISQRVRTLEAHLGVRLFERLPRSLALTEMGEAYLPAVRDVFEDLSAATSGLFGGSKQASLTVRVQIAYATTWLAPRLPDFCASFPHIDVQLVSAIWADALPRPTSTSRFARETAPGPASSRPRCMTTQPSPSAGPSTWHATVRQPASRISSPTDASMSSASTTCGDGSSRPRTRSLLRHRVC